MMPLGGGGAVSYERGTPVVWGRTVSRRPLGLTPEALSEALSVAGPSPRAALQCWREPKPQPLSCEYGTYTTVKARLWP